MPLVGVSPLVSFLAPSLGPSCLLVLYGPAALIGSSSHPLAFPSAACFLLIGSSARPLPRIAWLPAPFDKRNGAARSANDHWRAVIGDVRMAASGWRRLLACSWDGDGVWAVIDGGLLRAAGVAWGCLLTSGRWTERLDRSSIVSLFSSSAHPIGSAPAPFIISSSHLIDGEGHSFSFSPDPLLPALLGLLALACSPVPGRGM